MSRTILLAVSGFLISSYGFCQRAQEPVVVGHVRAYEHKATGVEAPLAKNGLIDEHVVRVPGVHWISLKFDSLNLPKGSHLEIRSLLDGDVEVMSHESMQTSSAFFNGDAVRVRLFAETSPRNTFYNLNAVAVGDVDSTTLPQDLCGNDNRASSTDARIGRMLISRGTQLSVCTAWLFSNRNCFATAGHCFAPDNNVNVSDVWVQFNVPQSDTRGRMRNPTAANQYRWNGTGSRQYRAGLPGDDWAVFTTRANTTTQKHAGEVQGSFFSISTADNSNTLRVTGYGTDSTPLTRNFTQQTATGSRFFRLGSNLQYVVDTEGGVSGGPVVKSNGFVIAVHTHGFCNTLGFNSGTYTGDARFAAARTAVCRTRPDFIVTAAFVSGNPGVLVPNRLYTGVSTVKNIGNTSSGSFRRTHRLSTNTTISASDTLLTSLSTEASLAANAQRQRFASFRMPSTVRAGTCYFGAIADEARSVAELDETNNTGRSPAMTCQAPGIDYVATSLVPSTSTITANAVISISSTVRNNGGLASNRSTWGRYVISADSNITTSDRLLAPLRSINPLGVNDTHTTTTPVRIPKDLAPGTCYLGLIVDSTKNIAEIDETNNTIARKVTCAGLPDLVVTTLRPSATTFVAGGSLTATATVRNDGGVSTGRTSYSTSFYLSTDSRITTSDVRLASVTTPALGAARSTTVSARISIPVGTRTGSCFLGAIVDSANVIKESFETNNTRSTAVRCEARPDLVVTRHRAATLSWVPNRSVRLETTLANRGAASTGRTSVATFYMSEDTRITTSDTFIGSVSVPVIDAGKSFVISQSPRLPNLKPGACYLGVIADRFDFIKESFESNNTASVKGVCSFGRPDLRPTTVRIQGTHLQAGQRATITNATQNLGEGPAPASRTLVVLSDDTSISTSDVLLGTYQVPALQVNEAANSTQEYLVPYCTPAGFKHVGVIVDVDRVVSELVETNNTISSGIPVRDYKGSVELIEYVPDYTSAASSIPSGASFRLSAGPRHARMCITARNQANQPYLLLWSGSASYTVDSLTLFGLSFLNTGVFPNWIGRLDANGYGRLPAIHLPRIALDGPIVVYTHLGLIQPDGSVRIGSGGAVRSVINP